MAIRFHCPRQECRSDRCPAKKIFSCLSPGQDSALGRERLARHYEAGQVVIHHDTPALAILSIHSGQAKLIRATHSGGDVVVGVRGPGELLGVREVLSGMPYQVSAETLTPSVLCAVPREAFLDVVRDCPELAMRLLAQLARDYLLTEEQLVARTHVRVVARTARLLLALTDERGADAGTSGAHQVPMSREEMALLVGTTRETLSRSLARLSGQGAVRLRNGVIRILDRPILERLSGQ
jgi:CRP/FNR family transcriptional regulator